MPLSNHFLGQLDNPCYDRSEPSASNTGTGRCVVALAKVFETPPGLFLATLFRARRQWCLVRPTHDKVNVVFVEIPITTILLISFFLSILNAQLPNPVVGIRLESGSSLAYKPLIGSLSFHVLAPQKSHFHRICRVRSTRERERGVPRPPPLFARNLRQDHSRLLNSTLPGHR